MATFNVTAPAGDYNGAVGKIQFHDGAALIDDETNPSELAYCRSAGYLVTEAADSAGEPDGDKPFDPSEHNAEDVLAYLDGADEAEAERVLDAEAAGKSRKGITGQRDAILASKKESAK